MRNPISTSSTADLNAVAAETPPARHPDAGLIADCAELERLHAAFIAAYDGPGAIEDDDELEQLGAEIATLQRPLVDRVCAARARTLAGHRARAKALACLDPEGLGDFLWRDTTDARLLAALLRDLLGAELPPQMAGEPQRRRAAAAASQPPAEEWHLPPWPEHKTGALRDIHRQLMALAEDAA